MNFQENNHVTLRLLSLFILLGSCLLLLLGGCATAARGSQTYFVVETLPVGAQVHTDKQQPSGTATDFYGCAATPCKISMSRRSQFNVMITKDGYAPFFYVVQKRQHKELKKDKEAREAFRLDTNGDIMSGEELSQNAGLISIADNPSLAAATGTALGAWYTGEIVSFMAAGGAVTAPGAVILAGPALMTGYGIDLTSGALIDLTPNPMIVRLAPEESTEETQRLKSAFMDSRNKKTRR